MTKEIYDEIVSLLEKRGPVQGNSDQEICNYKYLDAGHVDSLNIMQFILEIEESFGISLSTEDIQSDEFRTIGGIITLVERIRRLNS
jgi:acyl carrier protein